MVDTAKFRESVYFAHTKQNKNLKNLPPPHFFQDKKCVVGRATCIYIFPQNVKLGQCMETHLEAGGGEGGVVEEPRKVLRLFRFRVLLNLKPTQQRVDESSGIRRERSAGCGRDKGSGRVRAVVLLVCE